jgi:multimeric flavodoxin WrbA
MAIASVQNPAIRILALSGSPRKHGNTETVLDLLIQRMLPLLQAQGLTPQYELVRLADSRIETCRGCRVCFNRGEEKCPLHDDLSAITKKMRAADLIILTSPVYVDNASGLIKNWIDRLAYTCHRPEFAGIPAFTLTTSAGSPSGPAHRTLQGTLLTWGFRFFGKASFITGARMKADEIESRYETKMDKLARKFSHGVLRARSRQPNLLELTMFRIQQYTWSREDPASLDYQYWHSRGWTDIRTAYFLPHRANPISVFLARVVGTTIGRIFN